MKKYTNKILLITLIVMSVLFVVMGTVEIRKAFHNGEIKTTEEVFKDHLDKTIMTTDTAEAVDVRAEMEE